MGKMTLTWIKLEAGGIFFPSTVTLLISFYGKVMYYIFSAT